MARPIKHGDKWRIRWLDADGKRRSEVYHRKADTDRALLARQSTADEERRGLRPRIDEGRTFAELADRWLTYRAAAKRSKRDDESMLRRHLRPFLGELRLIRISVERVEEFKAQFPVGQKTLHNVLTLLVAMLNYAVELKWLPVAPKIRKPRIVIADQDFRYLKSKKEIERFLAAAARHSESTETLYAAAIYTGMRAGELGALRWNDVDFDRRTILVRGSWDGPTKAGYQRVVPILDPLLPILRRARLRTQGELVFPNQVGKMLQKAAWVFQEGLRAVLKDAGFSEKYLTFHGLRHTFASHWVMNGGDLYKLQKIGGWRSHSMIERYAHLSPDAFVGDFGRLGAANDRGAMGVRSLVQEAESVRPADPTLELPATARASGIT